MGYSSQPFWLNNLSLLARDCSGATKIEYSLIAALVSVAIVSGASDLGMLVYSLFNKTSQNIQQVASDPGDAGGCGPGNGNGNCGNKGNGGGNSGGSGPGTGNGGGGAGNGGSNTE